jgi:hypothetical protein
MSYMWFRIGDLIWHHLHWIFKELIVKAADRDRSDILEYFLAHEKCPHIRDLQSILDTALHSATKPYYMWNHNSTYVPSIRTVQMLLDAGADPNFRCASGRTPLHNAAKGGFEEIVRLLLERGANIRAVDANGKTPLHLAGDEGNEEVFLMMHIHLYGNLSNVRREEGGWQRVWVNYRDMLMHYVH